MRNYLCILVIISNGLLQTSNALGVKETSKSIAISDAKNTILLYHKEEVPPPKGSDPIYKRSAFIHPLKTPKGASLTSIHPADHIHHMGLWHAWVKTSIDGKEIDFWNLKKGQGTVRYSETLSIDNGKNQKGFTVIQNHIAFDSEGNEKVIIKETFSIKVSITNEVHFIDYISNQQNITNSNFNLPSYRYGGPIAYRGPDHWNSENSKLLTSEGKNRNNGHATRANRCAFYGPTKFGQATLAILSHPNNHDSPQRMRIWSDESNNGAIFFNFVPAQERPWGIDAKKNAEFKYRVILTDSILASKKINEQWIKYSK